MSLITKPMLAPTEVPELSALKYPLIASPKLDGIRALMIGGKLVSRSLKPIPNRFIRSCLEAALPDGIDGELMCGENFQNVTSGVMSPEGSPHFSFHIFDFVTEDLNLSYEQRLVKLRLLNLPWQCTIVPTCKIEDEAALLQYEQACLSHGYEGIMLRSPYGPYKCGRATLKQGIFYKFKRFVDSEAEIIGFQELMHNENIAETNELGRTKRSTKKAGLVGAGVLGALHVRDIHSGVEFFLGTGFTAEQRSEIYENQPKYLGAIAKYKSQPHGVKDKPRIPSFQGIRSREDM